MAEDQGSKVANFVAQRNSHKQNDQPQNVQKSQSYEDVQQLKVPMALKKSKSAAASNTPAIRESARPQTRSTAAQDRHIPDDTDFTSVDKASIASGTRRAHSHGDQVHADTRKQAAPTHEPEHIDHDPRFEMGNDAALQYDNSSEGLPNDPYRQPQQGRQHVENGHGAYPQLLEHPVHQSIAQQHVKGDSYPPTTSGNPSVADRREELPPYSTQPVEDHYPAKITGAMPTRGGGAGGTRLQLNAGTRPPNPGQQNHNQEADLAARHPPMPFVAPNLNSINAGFAFGRGPGVKPGGPQGPAPAQLPQHGGPPQSHAVPTNVAHRDSAPVTNLSSHQDRRQRPEPGFSQKVAAEPQQPQRQTKRSPRRASTQIQTTPFVGQVSQQSTRAPPVQRHEHTIPTVENNDMPAVDYRQHYKHRDGSYGREYPVDEELDGELDDELDEEPDYIDYEEEELYAMDYATLKDESFDYDPQADDLELPGVQQQDSLPANLQAASVLSHQDQSAFFKSLPAEQWEEAGDWFLDLFGEVLKKFKVARQEKRQAAKEFEDEIEKRHEAVSKKRKLTEDAFGEMRKTGSVVLQGTPKKLKKTK